MPRAYLWSYRDSEYSDSFLFESAVFTLWYQSTCKTLSLTINVFLDTQTEKKDSSCEDEEFLLPSLLTFLCFLTAAIAEQIQRNFMAQTMSEEELKVHFKHTV